MRTAKGSEKREKSTTEFIVVVILLGFLMKIFISYFFAQEQSITQAGFKTLAQNFKNTVVVVHAQWLMEHQPHVISLSSVNNDTRQAVTVNKKGWLDTTYATKVSDSSNDCENIWQLAMNRPLALMKFSIAAIEIHQENLSNYHQCRYLIPSGEYFEYSSATGKVTQVKQN